QRGPTLWDHRQTVRIHTSVVERPNSLCWWIGRNPTVDVAVANRGWISIFTLPYGFTVQLRRNRRPSHLHKSVNPTHRAVGLMSFQREQHFGICAICKRENRPICNAVSGIFVSVQWAGQRTKFNASPDIRTLVSGKPCTQLLHLCKSANRPRGGGLSI